MILSCRDWRQEQDCQTYRKRMPNDSHLQASVNVSTLHRLSKSIIRARPWMGLDPKLLHGRRRQLLELLDVSGAGMGVTPVHQPLPDQPRKRFFEGKRAAFARNGDFLV